MMLSEALLSHAQWWFSIESPLNQDPSGSNWNGWTGSANKRLRIYNRNGISYVRLMQNHQFQSLAFSMTMLCLLERQIVLEEESERNHHGPHNL